MMGSFLKKLFFLSQNGQFFQIFESSLEVQRVKEKFSNNPGHNILELFNNLVQVQIATSKTKLGLQYNKSPQVKRNLVSSITNLVHESSHELLNHLGLRILGNQEIFKKCQMQVETQPSAQSCLQKLKLSHSSQKTRNIISQIFLVWSNFTVFLYFMPNILS